MGPYVLDFYCPKAKLALEVDGDTHSHPEQAARDGARDRWLNGQGIEVLRIPAVDVLRDVDGTADLIWRTAEARV